jgi:hypothetical protein
MNDLEILCGSLLDVQTNVGQVFDFGDNLFFGSKPKNLWVPINSKPSKKSIRVLNQVNQVEEFKMLLVMGVL